MINEAAMTPGFHHSNILKTCGFLFNLRNSAITANRAVHSFKLQCVSISELTQSCASCNCKRKYLSFPLHHSWRHRSTLSTKHIVTSPVMAEDEENSANPIPKDILELSVEEVDGWINVGQYDVFAWSVSGVESCILVKSSDLLVAFDMGIAVPESVKAANVFITHGHVDHIGAVSNHVAKRSLNNMKPARYYVPPHLVDNLKAITNAHYQMAETVEALDNVWILPFTEGESIHLNKKYFVKAFPTIHRIPSQGYILYKIENRLKEEFRGMEGFEVAALHREGKEIHDIIVTPEVAYTGDTTFDIFKNPPTPDLLKVKLLITEATYIHDTQGAANSMVQKARDRGHCHLVEFGQNADLFCDVGHIILVHFSNQYPCRYIMDLVKDRLPTKLRNKVTPATVAKSTSHTTYMSS